MEPRDPLITAAVVFGAVIILVVVVLLLLSGGNGRRLHLAFRSFGRAAHDSAFADQVEPLLQPPAPVEVKPARPSGVPLRLLALLQREGRLLDFLLEDIQAYSDDQVGAAVRDIHRLCQNAIKEHLTLAPVLSQPEGAAVEVPAGFDPSAIRLTGNVTGQPPFRGTLRHPGWRVQELKLDPPPEGQDELVLMPAEVELP
jgi:hypothetical protein